MKDCKITKYGDLDYCQKTQAVEIFLEGFGHFITFSKDKDVLKQLFLDTFHPEFFMCYVEDGQVMGILGVATNKIRPVKFDNDVCVKLFGKIKGRMVSKQMNAVFQTPVVKEDRELYIDVLATAENARGKGVATTLLNWAFALEDFDSCYLEVFSKNEIARNLYEKMGFVIEKEKKISLMRFAVAGSGYPIKMKKYY